MHRCLTPKEDMNEMIDLLRGIHRTLKNLNITHFLIYGSLIGAIRYNNILPWDNDLDIGVKWTAIASYSNSQIKQAFAQESITTKYWYRNGFYRLTKGKFARADLMIFHDYYHNGVMRRIGAESYYAWLQYRMYHSFPARLLDEPLPVVKFAGLNMSVPRGGREILKLLYPYDYWKEAKPHGCKASQLPK